MKYAVKYSSDKLCDNAILDSKKELDEWLLECHNTDGDDVGEFEIYPLGAKMTATVTTKIEVK